MGQKIIYEGQVVNVTTQTTVLPNGHEFEMEIVHHPGGAAVVAVNDKKQVCLLKQFRCVMDEWLWELPAGKIDHMEDPLNTAKRELTEETGVLATQWQSLGYCISSPGVFTEKVHLYLAGDLHFSTAQPEPSEVFQVHWINMQEAWRMAEAGDISDAKSVVGLFRALVKIYPGLAQI
ncbi:MAG: NUDIX hydrolase [Gammaproteobacteria bacterium]|nr:NUDIX hydrolase [Gammaproteobacteria bacterium]MDH5800981.1 NUDIX hydrolase [Gammaproteobacteria bacterium]